MGLYILCLDRKLLIDGDIAVLTNPGSMGRSSSLAQPLRRDLRHVPAPRNDCPKADWHQSFVPWPVSREMTALEGSGAWVQYYVIG